MIVGINDAVLSMNMATRVTGALTTVAIKSLASSTIKVYSGATELAITAACGFIAL